MSVLSNPTFSSLNLAAATQIMCYELFLLTEQAVVAEKNFSDYYARQAEIEHLYAHAKKHWKRCIFTTQIIPDDCLLNYAHYLIEPIC